MMAARGSVGAPRTRSHIGEWPEVAVLMAPQAVSRAHMVPTATKRLVRHQFTLFEFVACQLRRSSNIRRSSNMGSI
jgi:hypothetical protein